MFSSCFPAARLDLRDEDNVVALALAECSARPYAELIKSNIPSSSCLMSARSSTSRPSPPFALGVSSLGPTAATPTSGEILVHLRATSQKPRSAKRKNPSSSEKDRPVPAKVQKLGVSPPSPVREPERASTPLAEVQNSGASPPFPAQEPEQASSPLVLTSLPPPKPDEKAKGLSGAAVEQPLTIMPITVWNPLLRMPSHLLEGWRSRRERNRNQKLMRSRILYSLTPNSRQEPSHPSSWSLTLGGRKG